MSFKKTASLLALLGLTLNACTSIAPKNGTSPETTGTLSANESSEEAAYYANCATNPRCRTSHILSEKDPIAQVAGTLVTTEDEKSKTLAANATAYIETFDTNAAEDRAAFLPADYPENLKSSKEFAIGKVLAYDDKYVYMLVDTQSYYMNQGMLSSHSASTNLPYRFEYNPMDLSIIDHKESGEGLETLDNLFPQAVKDLQFKQVASSVLWPSVEEVAAREARAKEALK